MRFAATVCQIAGGLAFVVALALAHDLLTRTHGEDSPSAPGSCQGQSDAIGLAFRVWAQEHHNQFPFNVSTNEGGTRELCARGADGFDRNAWLHFRALSNEIADPAFLVCPRDRNHRAARNFQSLGPENITYRLRTGPNVTPENAEEVLFECPLHGIAVHCDGELEGWESPAGPGWRYATSFRQGVGQVLICLGVASILIGLGGSLRHAHKHRQP